MPIDEKDMQQITRRLDERYVKREDCDSTQKDIDRKLHSDDKKLANEQNRIDREIEEEQNPKKEYKYEDSAEYGFNLFWDYVEGNK